MVEPRERVPPRRMGRPPLGVVKTTVALPPELVAEIVAIVGPRGLAGFLREAAKEELARRKGKQV